MSLFARVLLVLLVVGQGLVACSSNPSTDTADRRPQQAPLAPVDEDAQRGKAVATRVAAGMEGLKAGDAERARRHITRALELDPKSADAHNAMALYYRFEGDQEREEEHFRKALSLNSKFSQARNNYASLLYRQGRYKAAISQLQKAVDDTNYDQRQMAFLNLGRCYARTGDYEKAENALQRSLRLDSNQADSLLELADVYRLQGKLADAHNYFGAYAERARPTAYSLWVGIRIEQALGNVDNVSSYELQLDKMFRNTPEYKEWQSWKSGTPPPATKDGQSRKGVN